MAWAEENRDQSEVTFLLGKPRSGLLVAAGATGVISRRSTFRRRGSVGLSCTRGDGRNSGSTGGSGVGCVRDSEPRRIASASGQPSRHDNEQINDTLRTRATSTQVGQPLVSSKFGGDSGPGITSIVKYLVSEEKSV
jgi:hypothetical protein